MGTLPVFTLDIRVAAPIIRSCPGQIGTPKALTNASQRPGRYSVTWNRQDDQDRKLAEGVNFIRLASPNFEQTQKAVLTK